MKELSRHKRSPPQYFIPFLWFISRLALTLPICIPEPSTGHDPKNMLTAMYSAALIFVACVFLAARGGTTFPSNNAGCRKRIRKIDTIQKSQFQCISAKNHMEFLDMAPVLRRNISEDTDHSRPHCRSGQLGTRRHWGGALEAAIT
jgi:hypothetical protein